ncbi:unnamed protein product [Heterobilharzia americana]|nr:unnamed protein product [Heterobilharzia americana]
MLDKGSHSTPKISLTNEYSIFVRYDREPHDVLEWLKALPLPHLHHSEDASANSIWDRKTPTGVTSMNNMASTAESPDSVTTINPDISKGLSNISLDDISDLKKVSWEEINSRAEIDVTLVAAPMINTNSDTQSQFIINEPLTNSDQFGNENTCISNVSSRISEKSSVHQNPSLSNTQNTVADHGSGNFIHFLEGKSNKFFSQTSSGYGSAGSDSSPGSLGSDSRPPSSTQVLDLGLSHRTVNGIPPLPAIQRSKPTCVLRINKSDKYSMNASENNMGRSKMSVHPMMSDLSNHPICQRASPQTVLGSDQWSTSSLSSRTTHINTSHPIQETSVHNPLPSLIEKFEPILVRGDSIKDISKDDKHNTSKQIVSSVTDMEKRTEFPGSSEIELVCSRITYQDTNKRKAVGQTRSSSVGAQLQRSPAQRWSIKPAHISRNPQIDLNSSVGVLNGNNTRTRSPIVLNTTSPLQQNCNYETIMRKSTSPQQYHHHYFYYYYDNQRDLNSQKELSSTSWMSKDNKGTFGRKVAGSNANSIGSNCKSACDVLPFPSGRMCQRLFTHPIPRQNSLHCSPTSSDFKYSKAGINLLCPSAMMSSRLPLTSQSTYQITSKESDSRFPDQNTSHPSVFNNITAKDNHSQKYKGKSHSKFNYRSMSQPPKSREWLSFETEL